MDKPACKNCLNAYNNPYTTKVLCCNKDFIAQYKDIDTSVQPDEVCGTYTRRRDSQPQLNFKQTIQLTINFEL